MAKAWVVKRLDFITKEQSQTKSCMKKSKKVKGRKPRRYSIAHHKRHARRARMPKHEKLEHMEMAKKLTPREREIVKMLLRRGLKFPGACEIAMNCDAEPAWL